MKWYHYLILLLVMYFFCECRTEYIPIESVRYDSLMIEELMRDSVFVRDSIYMKEKGDTIYEYKNKYVYVYKNRIDTFFVYRDREVEVTVPVERELSWWERVKMEYTEMVFGLVFIIVLIYSLRKWIAKKIRKE